MVASVPDLCILFTFMVFQCIAHDSFQECIKEGLDRVCNLGEPHR